MDQSQYLANEEISVALRIVNHSGQTIRFGSNDWLSFMVESYDGMIVQKFGDPPSDHNFDLETSQVATQRLLISPCFDLSRIGRYKITATVRLYDWEAEVTSPALNFDVISGVKMMEIPFGVPPSSPDSHEPPEIRKYILQKASYTKHLRLYLKLTDQYESQVYRVMPIGGLTSFSTPQTRLDRKNNLHLLYEESARTYSYTVINPDGLLQARQQYGYVNEPPRLKVDDQGFVYVSGAVRQRTDKDYPPTPPSLRTNLLSVTNLSDTGTNSVKPSTKPKK